MGYEKLQLLDKVKDLIATRGNPTVMHVYMEQASEQLKLSRSEVSAAPS